MKLWRAERMNNPQAVSGGHSGPTSREHLR